MDLKSKMMEQLNVTDSVNEEAIQKIVANTFLWMGVITAITFAIGYYIVSLIKTGAISAGTYTIAFWASFVFSLLLIIVISFFWQKFTYPVLAILALVFSLSEGVGLAGILSMYNASSVINAFAGAAVMFLLMAFYGYTTKTNLLRFGTLFMVGVIAIIILSLLNAFIFKSSGFELILSIVGLILFLGLTAYDLQALKYMATSGDKRVEILFGVALYIDFIVIFQELLKLFGSSED